MYVRKGGREIACEPPPGPVGVANRPEVISPNGDSAGSRRL